MVYSKVKRKCIRRDLMSDELAQSVVQENDYVHSMKATI